MLLALLIFIVTYTLISLRRIRGSKLTRPTSALFGAALMILFGVVSLNQAVQAIDVNILLLILGMMIIVGVFELTGFFNWVVYKLLTFSENTLTLFIIVSVSTAFLSSLFLNDAIVLFFTPIIIKLSENAKINPEPFLLTVIFSANIGSVATEIGNPQNAYIAIKSGIPFFFYLIKMLPVSIISLLISMAILYLIYKNDLRKKIKSEKVEKGEIVHKNLFYIGIATMILIFISFLFVRNIAIVPFVGASFLLFITPLFENFDPRKIIKSVDWGIILFFIGLFIVLEGVQVSGLLKEIMDIFQIVAPLTNPFWYVTLVSVLSNLVSNVPAVMLLSPSTSGTNYWLSLAMSSTLAGNATILGAAANVIVLEIASTMGYEINWLRFSKAGLPVSIITILIGTVILFL